MNPRKYIKITAIKTQKLLRKIDSINLIHKVNA